MNHVHVLFFRIKSRVLVVPFDQLSIGPADTEASDAFEGFEEALNQGEYSSAIGWVIRQGE